MPLSLTAAPRPDLRCLRVKECLSTDRGRPKERTHMGAAWPQTEANDGACIHHLPHSPIQVEVGSGVSGGSPELAQGAAVDARAGTGHLH